MGLVLREQAKKGKDDLLDHYYVGISKYVPCAASVLISENGAFILPSSLTKFLMPL